MPDMSVTCQVCSYMICIRAIMFAHVCECMRVSVPVGKSDIFTIPHLSVSYFLHFWLLQSDCLLFFFMLNAHVFGCRLAF